MPSLLELNTQKKSQLIKELDDLIVAIKSLNPKSEEYSKLCLEMAKK